MADKTIWARLASRLTGGRARRRFGGLLAIALGLLAVGGVYTLVVPGPQVATAAQQQDPGLLARGRDLYDSTCIACHGANLQGLPGRAPSLIGAGDAAVYFQVSTGRMPAAREQAEALRKPPLPEFDPNTPQGRENLRALGAYVQANGGGPERPVDADDLVGDDEGRGAAMFRLNCASCHNFTGRGGALLSGKYAPNLYQATPEQIYTAMQSGPSAMPRFGDRELADGEKRDIIAYILAVRGERNTPGGYSIGEIGPTAEGIVGWMVGLAALIGIAAWIGARS